MTKLIKVKEWVIDREQATATRYNCFIDFTRNEDDTRKVEEGFITCYAEEVLKETEKAIQVRLGTGRVLGSANGWKVWVPKSCCVID